MAKRGTRHCIVCGKEYVYCPNCGGGNKEETWRYLYDTEQCNEIFNVLSRYTNSRIDKNEAEKQLKALKVTKGMKFTTEIENQISEIFKAEKAQKDKEDAQIVKED